MIDDRTDLEKDYDKRQRAIDSASGDRDATSAQSAEEQRFLHGTAGTGQSQ